MSSLYETGLRAAERCRWDARLPCDAGICFLPPWALLPRLLAFALTFPSSASARAFIHVRRRTQVKNLLCLVIRLPTFHEHPFSCIQAQIKKLSARNHARKISKTRDAFSLLASAQVLNNGATVPGKMSNCCSRPTERRKSMGWKTWYRIDPVQARGRLSAHAALVCAHALEIRCEPHMPVSAKANTLATGT